jgi:hypothetical protein
MVPRNNQATQGKPTASNAVGFLMKYGAAFSATTGAASVEKAGISHFG